MTPSQPGAVRPVPERLHTVTPRLVVADGAAAMAFYAEAFGAQEAGERFTGPNGELIHAETRIGNSVVMITEDVVDGPVGLPGAAGRDGDLCHVAVLGRCGRGMGARGRRGGRGDLPTGGPVLR